MCYNCLGLKSDKALQLPFGDCLVSTLQVLCSKVGQKICVKLSKPKSTPAST